MNADLVRTGADGQRKAGISADALKVIAMVTMAIDHTGAALFPYAVTLRVIGRIAFPIYMWLLVMGFVHTSSRKKYMLRMAALAVVSEFPFDLALTGEWTFQWQNIYFTLLLSLLLMVVLEKAMDVGGRSRRIAMVGAAVIVSMLLAEWLNFDYSCTGPVLAAVFYLYYRTGRPDLFAGFFLFCFSRFFNPVLNGEQLTDPYIWLSCFLNALLECCGAMAIPFIRNYNGVRKWKRGKAFFYLFYPVHLLILYGIRTLFF
ncbi:MAG: TraX family protein [Eubacteriales bacterium]|nr:TraX family protein [Eubacteriales bacterium]